MTPTREGTTKDILYGKIEVAEFMGNDTLNVISQSSVETQITEFHQVDQIFLYTESVT